MVFGLAAGVGTLHASVRVSDFGFDAEDATEIVQRALDSGARTLILDRQAAPWTIRPVFVRSDTELVFEEGVELTAKEGAFRDEWDSLITARNASNLVFRALGKGASLTMRRADYGKAPYAFSEHRHIFNLLGTANVTIENLRIAESGGDGIYLGQGRNGETCRNTVIRRCDCDRNHRQGVSVITANGLLIEDTKLRNTIGTAPKAGIDFEPNSWRHELVDCTLRDCDISGNDGHGVDVYLGQLRAATKPISIRIEDCRIAGNARFARFSGGYHRNPDDAVGGSLTFANCTFEGGSRKDASFSLAKPANAFRAVLSDCTIVEPEGGEKYCLFPSPADFDRPLSDGFTFADVTIRQPKARAWAAPQQDNWCAKRPTDWTGRVTVVTPEGSRTETLDAAWCAKAFPPSAGEPIGPLVKGDFAQAAVEDGQAGEMTPTSTLGFRGKARFVFYAAKGTANFRMRYVRMKDYPNRTPTGRIDLCAVSGGKAIRTVAKLSYETPDVAFAVDVPRPGFWALQADITECAQLRVTEADVPLAVDCTDGRQQFIYSTGEASFFVPAGAKVEAIVTADPGEYVGMALADAQGDERFGDPAFSNGVRRFLADRPAEADGFWTVRFAKPSRGNLRKYYFHVRNVPGYLFLTPARRWRFGGVTLKKSKEKE